MGSGRTVAVVLTHRRPRLATQSVRHLLDVERMAPANIVVVVNGEGGLSDPDLAASVDVVHLAVNTGPAGGMRTALEYATADPGVEWVYLCEDDIGASNLPGPRLQGVRDLARRYEHDHDRPLGAVVAYGRRLDRRTGLTVPHVPQSEGSGLIPTDVASWGASLVSRRVVDAGVLPDDSLFFGYEDFDFWLAMREAGFDLLLDAGCARHLGHSVHPTGRETALGHARPIDDTEPWRRYYEARNFIHLSRRHGHVGWTATHLAKSVRRGALGGAPHRRAILDGLLDGFRGRTGVRSCYLRDAQAGERSGAST